MNSQGHKKEKLDFRLFLQQEFVARCQRNSRYSLRSYAKSLSVAPSPLSAMLRGQRPITDKMKKRLGLALGLGLEDLAKMVGDRSRSQIEYQQIALDHFAVISDWYHFAILELIRLRSFKADLGYIAKALGISKTEVDIAVERLQRIGLLKIEADQWTDQSANGFATNINEDLTSQASKKLQRQILEMAIEALESLPTEVRNNTAITMAVGLEDLPEAKKRIKKFRRDMCHFFEKNKKPTQIYNLGICLYPITKIEESHES